MMTSNAKIYEKPIHGVTKSGSKHYFVRGVEVTRKEYTKFSIEHKRDEILFLIEADNLPAAWESLLYEFFESVALDSDLHGSAAVVYQRYRRAMLCFIGEKDF